VVTAEVFDVTTNRTEEIGVRRGSGDNDGLMLTTDENIVDIDFQVVWNIKDAEDFKFSLRDPDASVRAISESAMREVIAQSELAPILNRDRAAIEARVRELIQETLDNRQTGINIIRVNFNKVDPPSQQVVVTDSEGRSQSVSVIDAFRDVQAAEQERDRVERQADAYANQRTAQARGESAQLLEAAEGYRARVVNDAVGEASRFLAVLTEYNAAPEVTRKRLYLETMEKVLGDVDKIILESNQNGEGGQGVVPYLPLNELRRNSGGSN
jgi:membrane protease subunit HflK